MMLTCLITRDASFDNLVNVVSASLLHSHITFIINNYIVGNKIVYFPTHFDWFILASIDALVYSNYYRGVCKGVFKKFSIIPSIFSLKFCS